MTALDVEFECDTQLVTQVKRHRMRCQRLRWSSSGINSRSGWASEKTGMGGLISDGNGRTLLEKLPRDQWSSGDLNYCKTLPRNPHGHSTHGLQRSYWTIVLNWILCGRRNRCRRTSCCTQQFPAACSGYGTQKSPFQLYSPWRREPSEQRAQIGCCRSSCTGSTFSVQVSLAPLSSRFFLLNLRWVVAVHELFSSIGFTLHRVACIEQDP